MRAERLPMTEAMDARVVRIALVLAGLAVLGLLQAGLLRGSPARAGGPPRLTAAIEARGLTFKPDVAPADRAWVLAAIAAARPEARELIGAVDGLVTISTFYAPNAPYVGYANPNDYGIGLNLAYLDGDRKQDREQTVLHELGHIVDFVLVPDATIAKLAAEIPVSGVCATPETGDCTSASERFADTFAKWALRGAVSRVGAGYAIGTPASLEQWGQPLDLLAAQISA
jgi:hypothetical protein